jgi:DnaK suppressor protein
MEIPLTAGKSFDRVASIGHPRPSQDLESKNMSTPAKALTEKALLAMPASAYMNAAQLGFFRDLLRKQRQDLLDNATMTIDHLRDGEAEADPNDRATIEEENSIELRIRDRERKMLPRVEAALKRIEDGQYGFCEETGDPIGLRRLLARPTTVFSIEAQERHESRQRIQGK